MESGIKKFNCHYAIIRFLPYPETSEFANVGVVLACPEINYFGYKLIKRKHSRVTKFFEEIDAELFRHSLSMFEQELKRISNLSEHHSKKNDELKSIFKALVHPREAIIRFSDPAIRLAANPELILHNLFSYYVERNFVTPEYKEQKLVQKVRDMVQSLRLETPFKPKVIGDNLAQANFPLVQMENELPIKIIKPFFLGQSSPQKIIAHGGAWVDKITRLQKRNLLPKSILFAIDGPDDKSGDRHLAYKEIFEDLKELDVSVIPATEEKQLISFAKM